MGFFYYKFFLALKTMEAQLEFKRVDTEKVVIVDFNGKKYQFKALERISKNNNPYIGLFVKNGYKGFLNIHLNSGKLVVDNITYNMRLLEKNSFEFTEEKNNLKNSYQVNRKKYLTNYNFHEDNIKAEIYARLRDNNINCQLEYIIPRGRVDIAIKNNKDEVVGLIEVKKPSGKYEINRRSNIRLDNTNKKDFNLTKQFNKYLDTGLPLLISTGYQNIPIALAFAKSLL